MGGWVGGCPPSFPYRSQTRDISVVLPDPGWPVMKQCRRGGGGGWGLGGMGGCGGRYSKWWVGLGGREQPSAAAVSASRGSRFKKSPMLRHGFNASRDDPSSPQQRRWLQSALQAERAQGGKCSSCFNSSHDPPHFVRGHARSHPPVDVKGVGVAPSTSRPSIPCMIMLKLLPGAPPASRQRFLLVGVRRRPLAAPVRHRRCWRGARVVGVDDRLCCESAGARGVFPTFIRTWTILGPRRRRGEADV